MITIIIIIIIAMCRFVLAERVLYLPSLGFCILVVHGMSLLYDHIATRFKSVPLTEAFIIILTLLSARTVVRGAVCLVIACDLS